MFVVLTFRNLFVVFVIFVIFEIRDQYDHYIIKVSDIVVSRGDRIYVIYPEYFDINLSRSDGRKVAKKYAVQSPRLEDLTRAAKAVGLRPIVEENVSYPGKWWKKSGRILVPKNMKKSQMLIKMGTKMKKMKRPEQKK